MSAESTGPVGTDAPPPAARLLDLSFAYLHSAAISVAAKVGVADQLAQGPRTAPELAAHAGVDADRLTRVLRLLSSIEVFREDDTGRFHLTRWPSRCVRTCPAPCTT